MSMCVEGFTVACAVLGLPNECVCVCVCVHERVGKKMFCVDIENHCARKNIIK